MHTTFANPNRVPESYTEKAIHYGETLPTNTERYAGQHRALTLGEIALQTAEASGDKQLVETARIINMRGDPDADPDAARLYQAMNAPQGPNDNHGDTQEGIQAFRSTDMTQLIRPSSKEVIEAHRRNTDDLESTQLKSPYKPKHTAYESKHAAKE